MFSRRTRQAPSTGRFHTAVRTVRPCQATSWGSPTLTAISRPTGRAALNCWEVTVAGCMVGLLGEGDPADRGGLESPAGMLRFGKAIAAWSRRDRAQRVIPDPRERRRMRACAPRAP